MLLRHLSDEKRVGQTLEGRNAAGEMLMCVFPFRWGSSRFAMVPLWVELHVPVFVEFVRNVVRSIEEEQANTSVLLTIP